MTLGATISLNDANGGWVAYRFQYFQVNAAGARTSAVYGGNWLGPYYVDTWTETAGAAWFGPTAPTTQMNNPVLLPGGTVTWAGRLHAQVEVAVWIPGYGYDYTGLMDINEYTSYYPTSLGTQSTTGSGCMTAW